LNAARSARLNERTVVTTFRISALFAFTIALCAVLAVATTIYKTAPIVDVRNQNLTSAQAAAMAKKLTEERGGIVLVKYK
jgi:hypothetical protein